MIRVDRLQVVAGRFALCNLSFEMPTGAYAVLMGRTGCGKTTLLEALTGLRAVDSGAIWVNGHDITSLGPSERNLGYVPQDRAPFQTMTVFENLAFSLRVRKIASRQVHQRVTELAELLGLSALLERKPRGLSGGEAQRVALGRALANRPDVLLLDEPLNALDERTRRDMYELLREIRASRNVTAIHVTHDSQEARELADLNLLLVDGRIIQTQAAGSDLKEIVS